MKLVRDRIPELAGQPDAFHQADLDEYGRLLRAKLWEEAAEAATAHPAELLEELGDALQILYALAQLAGLEPAAIECARARKARTRRGLHPPGRLARPLRPRGHPMSDGIFITHAEDGCPAAAGWIDYFDHLTLPLTGQDLFDAQATVAAWDDPDSLQGDLGDCWGCAAQVARLCALVDHATRLDTQKDSAP